MGTVRKGADHTVQSRSQFWREPNDDITDLSEENLGTPVDSLDIYWNWLRQGWNHRVSSNKYMQEEPQKYIDRLYYETDTLVPRGFIDYFLMLSHLVRWAKDSQIPVGPARGSAAASLVCYVLRITEVDPLQHPHMLYERFIDPKRLDLPDVDLDFADDRRDEVRKEAVRVFGESRVGNIGNFTRYRGKNSIDDVARVYNIPDWETEIIKNLIIERSGGDSRQSDSLQDTLDMFPKAAEVVERFPQLQLATRLEGNYRGLGVHAAGLVISNQPITDTCAMYSKESSGRPVQVLAYDKKDAEYLGMLKADLLGLSTMGMIGIALDIIGMDLEDLYRIPLDEPTTIAAFNRNDVTGIFQFEGRATRLVCGDVKPESFQELADINALSRPGPLFSGMTAQYVEVKHGRAQIEKLHPIVDELTGWTHGQIVYQEQVLTIIRDLGGFPVQRVGDIRKIISQKLGEASFQAMWEEFRDGAKRLHGVEEELALRIWRFMITSATYSFNVAHCVTRETVIERPRSSDNLTIGQMWDALNKYEKGSIGGADAAKGISYQGPCVSCGKSAAFYRAKQCSKCSNIRLAKRVRRLKGLSVGEDGRVRPNEIQEVFNNGVQPIHLVELEDGSSMRVTGDHSWMASDGSWTTTDNLQEGTVLLWFRRYSKNLNDQERCGPNYWKLKGRDKTEDVCEICGKEETGLDISHKDGRHSNDQGSNLWILCRSCHIKYDRDHNGRILQPWSKGKELSFNRVVKIVRNIGEEEVFTLQMSSEVGHNYITGNGAINKNCISYSMLAFWQMWLKQHHPTAFYAAQLQKVGDGKDHKIKRSKLMTDAVHHGQKIEPPSVQTSADNWTAEVELNTVRAGFRQVEGIGPKTSEAILAWRDEKSDPSELEWSDLLEVKGIGPKTISKIVEFAESEDPFDLNLVAKILTKYRKMMKKGGPDWYGVPRPTHRSHQIPKRGEHDIVWMGIVRSKNYQDYVENQRSRTGRDIEEIIAGMKDPHLVKSCVLRSYDDGDDDVYVRFNRWVFPKFEKILESLDVDRDIIIVKGKKREDFGISLHVQDIVVIDPTGD